MSPEAIPTWYFVRVVVRLGDRYLLVREAKGEQGWYLPAGRLEPGETFAVAAIREAREEAGIAIVLEGILRIEQTVASENEPAHIDVNFLARPQGAEPLKQAADEESLGAGWFTLDEVARLPLRSEEARSAIHYVAAGGPIYPLHLITPEDAPFRA